MARGHHLGPRREYRGDRGPRGGQRAIGANGVLPCLPRAGNRPGRRRCNLAARVRRFAIDGHAGMLGRAAKAFGLGRAALLRAARQERTEGASHQARNASALMCLALANFVTVDAAQERFRLREPGQWAIIEPLSSTERTRLLRDPMQHSTEKVFVGWRRGAVKALRAANSASPHPNPRALSAQASEMSDGLRDTDKLGKSGVWVVEPDGIEPTTSSMPLKRSPN